LARQEHGSYLAMLTVTTRYAHTAALKVLGNVFRDRCFVSLHYDHRDSYAVFALCVALLSSMTLHLFLLRFGACQKPGPLAKFDFGDAARSLSPHAS
jgi:hypothetical protein